MKCKSCKHCGSKWLTDSDWGGDWTIECNVSHTFWVTSPPEFIDIACSKYEKEGEK
jgi:hypothetical protein